MSRYIDIDKGIPIAIQAVVEVVGHGITQVDAVRIAEKLEDASTADVVEPVRCKDCKFWGIPNINDTDKSHYCCRDNMWCMPLRFANDYCSYGVRGEKNEG